LPVGFEHFQVRTIANLCFVVAYRSVICRNREEDVMNWLRKAMLFGSMMLVIGAQAVQDCAAAEGATVPGTPVHKIVDVVLESGNPKQTIQSGYTTMETATVSCRYSSCTLAMSIMSNISDATCSQEEWAIIGLVDGNSVDGGPDQGAVPLNGNYQSRSWQGVYSVGNGRHTIAFQIYAPCSVNANQWSLSYAVTTP
jgi:hypothetical protein